MMKMATPVHARATSPQPSAMSAPSSSPSVLIVDDDFDIRAMLTELLEDEGYQVVTAANGSEALSYLRSGDARPRFILLDLMMPVMNGWQFRAAQSQDPALASIPVVIITAHGAAPEQMDLGDTAGYLRKPIQIDALLETAERLST